MPFISSSQCSSPPPYPLFAFPHSLYLPVWDFLIFLHYTTPYLYPTLSLPITILGMVGMEEEQGRKDRQVRGYVFCCWDSPLITTPHLILNMQFGLPCGLLPALELPSSLQPLAFPDSGLYTTSSPAVVTPYHHAHCVPICVLLLGPYLYLPLCFLSLCHLPTICCPLPQPWTGPLCHTLTFGPCLPCCLVLPCSHPSPFPCPPDPTCPHCLLAFLPLCPCSFYPQPLPPYCSPNLPAPTPFPCCVCFLIVCPICGVALLPSAVPLCVCYLTPRPARFHTLTCLFAPCVYQSPSSACVGPHYT